MEINKITEIIIGSAYTVSNTLGCGFLEKVYENALAIEIKKQGLNVKQQFNLPVFYDGIKVGDYYADLFVEDSVIVELKSTEKSNEIYEAQLLNYLKAGNIKTGLLINFGKTKVEIKRLSK